MKDSQNLSFSIPVFKCYVIMCKLTGKGTEATTQIAMKMQLLIITTYSSAATLMRAFESNIGHSSCSCVVAGSNI